MEFVLVGKSAYWWQQNSPCYLLWLFISDFGELSNATNCIEERIHHFEAALITNFPGRSTLSFIIIYLMQTMYNTHFSLFLCWTLKNCPYILCLDSFKHYFELLHSISILIPNRNYVINEFCWTVWQLAYQHGKLTSCKPKSFSFLKIVPSLWMGLQLLSSSIVCVWKFTV